MADQNNDILKEDDPDEKEETSGEFASLLDNYMSEGAVDIRVGDKITGEVIAIGKDSVYVHIGGKEDGVVEKAELMNEDGELACRVGDYLDLYVVAAGEGEVRLSKAIAATGSADLLYEARQNRIPVQGKVTETCKGGFRVQVMGKTAFCPVSQMDIHYVEKPEEFVGAILEFLIERVESGGRNLIVNRRRHLERLQAGEREKFLSRVVPGDIMPARAVRIMPYGVFFELQPGVEGMTHISELSWSRVADPSEVVTVGESLPVKILSIEKGGGKSNDLKISLSVKQAAGDPWAAIAGKYKAGDRAEGRVTRCAPFGAFVELEPGIEGLVHISEASENRVRHVSEVLKDGQLIKAKVLSVDEQQRRISLSIKALLTDPNYTGEGIEDNSSESESPAPRKKRKTPLRGGLDGPDWSQFLK